MSIKLIAIDIDDTLLNSKHQLTQTTVNVIKQALAKKVLIVLCTGRPLSGIKNYLDILGISGDQQFAITYNGALSQSIAGRILSRHTLKADDFKRIAEFCNQNNVHYNVLDDQSNIFTSDTDISKYTVMQAYENNAGIQHISSVNKIPNDFILTKAMLVDESRILDKIVPAFKEEFGNRYYIVRSTPFFLEALNPLANKGNALSDLTSQLGFTANDVMAIGDERNDLPMFEYAGTAVAMGNAIDPVKEAANYQTNDNDHDGVAQVIKSLVLRSEESVD